MARELRNHLGLLATLALSVAVCLSTPAISVAQQAIELTSEERQWLSDHPVIRVASNPEFRPIEALDENGRLIGISGDYLRLVEQKTGIRFEVVPTTGWNEAIALAQTRKVDMFSAATISAEGSKYMLFTAPHIELPGVIIVREAARKATRLDQLRGMKVGVVSGHVWREWIRRDHPDIDLHSVSDARTGLLLVSFGQLDAMVANLATATHFLQKLGVTNLRVTAETGYHAQFAIATRRDWPVLNAILQKAVSSIGPEETRTIIGKWINLMPPPRFETRTILWAALLLAAMIALATFGVLAWNRSLRLMVRRQSESLRESEARYRAIVQDQTEYISRSLPGSHVLTFVNDAYAQCFGMPASDLIGTSFMEHVPQEERARINALFDTLSPNNPVIHMEHPSVTADGEIRWHHWAGRAIFDDDGSIKEVQGVGRDVTEMKRAADAMRMSEEKFSKAFRAGPDSILITRISDGVIIDSNDRFLIRTGRTWEGTVGRPISEVLTWENPEDRTKLTSALEATGECTDLETQFRYANGKLIDCLVSARTIEVEGEMCAITITRDITDQRKAANALLESEARLRDAIESITDGFVYYDAEMRLIRCNGKYREFYPWIDDVLVPGAPLAHVARTAAERGQDAEPIEDIDAWVQQRLEEFRNGRQMHEQHLRDGRWLLCSENRTSDGGGVGIRTDITERKKAEAALRESEERLRDAIESISEGFILFDAEDRFVMCNEKYRDFYPSVVHKIEPGVTHEELSRTAIETGAVRGSTENIEQRVETRLALHRSGRGIHEQQLADGRWVLCTEHRTSSGGTVGIRTDITERKRTEEVLRENEQHMRDYAEASADWFWEMDSDLRFTYLSSNVERIVGVPPEWHYGKTREDLLGEDYDETTWGQHLDDLRNRRPFRNFEYMRVGEGITPVWLRTSGLPVFSDDGTFLGYRGSGSDITELKIREEALRESEERFKAVVDNSPSIIVLKDTDSRLLMANRMFEQVNGITSEEARGKTPDQLFPADFATALLDMDRVVINERCFVERELDLKDRDGATKTRLVTKFPVCAPNGDVIAIGGIITDHTERKKVEEELRQAQKMEVVGQLTGGVAHDFNNLLMIITGNLELALESLDDNPEVADLVFRANQAAERGATLTHRLLAFSRKQTLMPGIVDLDALVSGLTNMLRRTLPEIVEIKTVNTRALWPCKADPSQIESAILNLAINARDAMPEGGKLTIETANVTVDDAFATAQGDMTPGDYVMIAVTDTGTGMTRYAIDHAYEPFFTTKEVGSGSGLGLSMIYGFVKQSGGHVTIYSEVGEGTTVRMYFPRSSGEIPDASAEKEDLEPRAQGETVLVVEDDSDVRTLTVALLRDLGYTVLQASDARSALEVLAKSIRVDLLFTDVVLPGGMSGPQLSGEVKRNDGEISVLYMSGYTHNAIGHQARLDGSVEILNKPFTKAALAQKVRSALDNALVN